MLRVTEIPKDCFSENHSLMFAYCPKVKVVGQNAFSYCKSLRNFYSRELLRIEKSAFYGCLSLSSTKSFENVKEFGDSCFSYCQSLVSIKLSKIKYIPRKMFDGSEGLKQVVCPDCEQMAHTSFEGCEDVNIVSDN